MSEEKKPDELQDAATIFVCGPQCVAGQEHQWDGPVVKMDNGGSSSCSKCGKLAIDVSLWVGP